MTKVNQASLLSVESSHSLSPKKIVEVKDKWVKVRLTMDSGAAGHVMPETMFPHVKLERKTSPKKFVAANGEQIKDLGEKSIPFKTNEGVQRCITFRSVNVVKPFISMQKVVQAGNTVVVDEKNPHIRNIRDGTTIKLDVNSGVYTMDIWICLNETGPVFQLAGTVSGQAAFDMPVRPAALCREMKQQTRKRWNEMQRQNWMELKKSVTKCQMEKEMRLMAKRSWQRQIGEGGQDPGTNRHEGGERSNEATHVPFRDWCAHCMM